MARSIWLFRFAICWIDIHFYCRFVFFVFICFSFFSTAIQWLLPRRPALVRRPNKSRFFSFIVERKQNGLSLQLIGNTKRLGKNDNVTGKLFQLYLFFVYFLSTINNNSEISHCRLHCYNFRSFHFTSFSLLCFPVKDKSRKNDINKTEWTNKMTKSNDNSSRSRKKCFHKMTEWK